MGKKSKVTSKKPKVTSKKPTVILGKTNIKTEINKIVEKRRADIKKFLLINEFNKAEKGSSAKNNATQFGIGLFWVMLAFITLGLFGLLIYGLINLKKYRLWVAFVEIMFAGVYIITAYSIHDKVFGGTVTNLSVLLALIPLILARGLMVSYPTMSKPFDNTIGYFWLSTFYTKQFEVMNSFKSRLFPSGMLAEFDNKIPFGWLLTTFDVENVEKSVDQLRKTQDTLPGSIVTDFYINETSDIDEVKSKLKELVEMKRLIGHCCGIFIASALGLAFSIAQAVPLKIIL